MFVCVSFLFFASSSSIIPYVCRDQTTLQIRNTREYTCGVRKVACHVKMALVAFGCVLSHVSGWLTSVEVFAAVTIWSVLLSVVSGREMLCGPLEQWSAGKLFHRGIRLQAAVASCAHVSCSGGREPSGTGANAVVGKSTFFGVLKTKARSCEPPLRAITVARCTPRHTPV